MIPVDLNAYLYQMERNVAAFAREVGREEVVVEYEGYAEERKRGMQALMWSEEGGTCRGGSEVGCYIHGAHQYTARQCITTHHYNTLLPYTTTIHTHPSIHTHPYTTIPTNTGQWHDLLMFDFDPPTATALRVEQIQRVYVSNWVPLYAGLTEGDDAQGVRAVQGLVDSGMWHTPPECVGVKGCEGGVKGE